MSLEQEPKEKLLIRLGRRLTDNEITHELSNVWNNFCTLVWPGILAELRGLGFRTKKAVQRPPAAPRK